MKKMIFVLLAVAMMFCALSTQAEQAPEDVILRLETDKTEGYGGESVRLTLYLTANSMGGLQTTLTWNEGYLSYVEGSATYLEAFAACADVQMINDTQAGAITLVHASTSGFTGTDVPVFTADFVLVNQALDSSVAARAQSSEQIAGSTVFSLAQTKATNASASLAFLNAKSNTKEVDTLLSDADSAWLSLVHDGTSSYPVVGERITVSMLVSTSGPMIGSMEGDICFDPAVFAYVPDSAAFTEAYTQGAATQVVDDSTGGVVRFTYAAQDGCDEPKVLTMQFDIVGGVNQWQSITLENVKVVRADQSAALRCYAESLRLHPSEHAESVYYAVEGDRTVVAKGDVVTVAITTQGSTLGGLQAELCYDSNQLEVVRGSAVFSSSFAQKATIKMANVATPGKISLVYTNANGYSPNGDAIFTVQFVVKHCGSALAPITLEKIKTINASVGAVAEIPSVVTKVCAVEAPHNKIIDVAVAATCTEMGLTEGCHCSVCGEVIIAQEELPALGHSEVVDEAIEPTCTADGLTEGRHCATCGEIFVAQEMIPAMGHQLIITATSLEMQEEDVWTLADFAECCEHFDGIALAGVISDESKLSFVENKLCALDTGCVNVLMKLELPDGYAREIALSVLIHAQKTMTLPAALQEIGEEAFAASAAEEYVLSEGIVSIGPRAFADSNVKLMTIPASVTAIDEDAFDGCNVTLIVPADSVAEAYALEHGIPYVAVIQP